MMMMMMMMVERRAQWEMCRNMFRDIDTNYKGRACLSKQRACNQKESDAGV